ncbi:hypothetical protein L1049_011107 [Liquidambar formosana]|uniref:Clp R domain-containing protein n=1 Tax=Liquidambar formosana TaxID=63359 RepID=A0AAP0RQM6_LIQFO
MRAGVCSVQQALTPEAASIVKQAVSLARRRGHAQVTSLHVASAMLASSTGLLRTACLQSHSHPLQCKALELCFNVALNRLPASTSSPLLGCHSPYPSLSNALVAAFKRAQAHQRRGSIENQQQPILALKIEIEQLVISILDDPSVSRVMREAGFSSTQVKTNVEQAVSLEVCSQISPPVSCLSKFSTNSLVLGTTLSQSPLPLSKLEMAISKPFDQLSNNKDVMSLLDTLMSKRKRNTVVVGECLASTESVVKGLMDKFDRGEVPGDLRYVQFINLPLFTLKNMSKEEIEQKLVELRCLTKSYVGRGVILYLGDLKWVSEFKSNYDEQRKNLYCPVEHMIMELRRLVYGVGDSGRLRLMGIATFQTYMRCKTGHPSLESLWELHPLTIPVGSLGLSLNLDSDLQTQFKTEVSGHGSITWPLLETGNDKHLTCYTDYSVNFDREARNMVSSIRNNESTTTTISTSSSLPSWLQQYKEENRRQTLNEQEYVHVRDLCKKWNSLCSSGHKHPHFSDKAFTFSSPSPSSSPSISSNDQRVKLHQNHLSWPLIFEPKHSPKEHQFWIVENDSDPKPDLLSNPNSTPNSATSSEAMDDMEGLHKFKELNAENLKILCDALERKVPWQKDIIPEIVSAILQCRSGKMTTKHKLKHREEKEETWLFFLGAESEAKEKIARELAKLVFGSQRNFISIGLSSFALTKADSTDDFGNKRMRDEMGSSYLDRLAEAVHDNPHRVFFMEDVEQVDYCSQMGIKRAIESGSITLPSGELVPLKDAIVIFSCESFNSMSRACSPPPIKRKLCDNEDKESDDALERSPCVSLDLNIAIGDDNGNEHSVADIGILDSVDRQIVFKIQEL